MVTVSQSHLTEVQKLTDFLVEDLHNEIVKSEKQPTHGALDIYAGGAAVMKFQNREQHAPAGGHLMGSKSTASTSATSDLLWHLRSTRLR